MEKRKNLLVILPFCLFITVFFLWALLLPDREFSPRENRYLQTCPSFSFEKLFNGSFTKDFEAYSSDQFALRERWIELKAALELGQGKRENNGIFLCRDDRLIEAFSSPDGEELERRSAMVKRLADNVEAPVTLALIPTSAELYGEQLPEGVVNDSQQAVIDSVYTQAAVSGADIASSLRTHDEEDLFYRTDHHWTSLGAFRAYERLGNALGYSPLPLESFSPQIVSDSFCGTAYSSSGFFWIKPDRIETLVREPENLLIRRFESQEPVYGKLYCDEYLSTKDQYRFFLGGNAPRVVIDTGNPDAPSLLLIRDSFADSLVPFLLSHFGRIHLLDLRYYRDSVSDYVQENKIDQICVLYSVSDFCTDSNLALMTR